MLKAAVKRMLPVAAWNRARLWQYKRTINRFPERKVRHSYGGFIFDVWISDPTAESWEDLDIAPLEELAFLGKRRLKAGARVFDIGAHQCVIAMILAKTVGPTGRVVALEANPHNARVAERNRQTNRIDNLVILNAAGSDAPGSIAINERLNGQVDDGSGEWGRIAVPARTIDDLVGEFGNPDVLFIDVEDYELKVLQGARRTLDGLPDCFVEVHVGWGLEKFGGSVAALVALLREYKYKLFIAEPKNLRLPEGSAFTPFSADSPVIRDRFYLIATRDGAD